MSVTPAADLSPSGHVDTFCRDHLPPRDTWPELLFELPELRYPSRLNASVELLDRTIERGGPDARCLMDTAGTAWSYAEVHDLVDRVTGLLRGRFGIVAGNRVLLRAPNTPWLVICWLAVLRAGAVAVTTMPLLRPTELDAIAEIARIDLALCDHRFAADLRAADLGEASIVLVGGETPDDLTVLVRDAPTGSLPCDTAADDVAMLAFTSGTTGRPKATAHFHRDLLAIADTFGARILRLTPADRVCGTPPLAFTFGLGGLVVFPLRAGASMLMLESVTPVQLAEAIEAHQASVVFTAPTAYKAMLSAGVTDRLGSLRRGVSAGEHLPGSTWREFAEATGVRLIDGIGSTEMLHVFISAADEDIRPGWTGRAVPGYRARIVDDAGEPVPPGTAGRLAVQGPTGCRYLADPRQAVYVQRGWNITGDIFEQDAEGYFRFVARDDDMIISSGYNIAGPEVEEALARHPAVAECAVVGRPDPERGQLVTAFVVPAPGVVADDTLIRVLQDHVKAVLAPYKYPRAVRFVPVLPRTSTGKVQRYVLRRGAS